MRLLTFGAFAVLAALGGCETTPRPTLTPEQCVATDWTALGYRDGAAGWGFDRVRRHEEACTESGVTPDFAAYSNGLLEGQRVYCTPANGFRVAARGGGYRNGWCDEDLEPAFLTAFADGVIVHQAYQRTTTADTRLAEARTRLDQIGYDMTAAEQRLAVEGITEAEVDALRLRLRSLRDERETTQTSMRDLEWAVDESRRAYAETRSRYIPTYGAF